MPGTYTPSSPLQDSRIDRKTKDDTPYAIPPRRERRGILARCLVEERLGQNRADVMTVAHAAYADCWLLIDLPQPPPRFVLANGPTAEAWSNVTLRNSIHAGSCAEEPSLSQIMLALLAFGTPPPLTGREVWEIMAGTKNGGHSMTDGDNRVVFYDGPADLPDASAEPAPLAAGITQLAPGDELADYRVESYVARGGMAIVYRARDIVLRRPVALKVIAPELAMNENFRLRFKRESQLAAAIEHPGIIPIYRAGEEDGRLYIAMRFVDGEDLGTVLRRQGGLPVDQLLPLFTQIASALDAAHAAGLVHRDVKPGNVLLTGHAGDLSARHVYLTDFGLTKRSASRDRSDHRRPLPRHHPLRRAGTDRRRTRRRRRRRLLAGLHVV